MIKFEDSEEAISGLARLIVQDPALPTKLRFFKKQFLEEKVIKDDNEYFNQQEDLLKKAENIASTKVGYLFEINQSKKKEYMVYTKINNEMVPALKKFETFGATFSFESLIKYLENSEMKTLITFDGHTENYLYTYPEVRKREEGEYFYDYEEDFIGYNSYHNPVKLNKTQVKLLRKLKIELLELDDEQKSIFEKDLKKLIKIDHLKPLED